MDKWTALAIAVVVASLFGSITISEVAKEKTKQYELQYGTCK